MLFRRLGAAIPLRHRPPVISYRPYLIPLAPRLLAFSSGSPHDAPPKATTPAPKDSPTPIGVDADKNRPQELSSKKWPPLRGQIHRLQEWAYKKWPALRGQTAEAIVAFVVIHEVGWGKVVRVIRFIAILVVG